MLTLPCQKKKGKSDFLCHDPFKEIFSIYNTDYCNETYLIILASLTCVFQLSWQLDKTAFLSARPAHGTLFTQAFTKHKEHNHEKTESAIKIDFINMCF